MKIRNMVFLVVLSVSVLSCTLTRRMERRGTAAALSLMQKRKPASEDSLPESGRHPGEGMGQTAERPIPSTGPERWWTRTANAAC